MQDFFSTLFVSGPDKILSAEVNGELAAKRTRYRQPRLRSYRVEYSAGWACSMLDESSPANSF